MAYCVNCGVKLRNSEKKCPLCNTTVYNPKKQKNYEPVYSDNIDTFKILNIKYLFKLITIILLVIAIIVLASDYLTSGNISWSIYVIASIMYLCCFLGYFLKENIYISHIINMLGLETLLLTMAILNNGMSWYLYLVGPFILIVWIYIILITILIRKKGNALRKLVICLFTSDITLIIIESFIDLYGNKYISLGWSKYAVIPISIISIIIFIISFNNRIIDEIKRRLFI